MVCAWSFVLEAVGSNPTPALFSFQPLSILFLFCSITFLLITGVYVEFWLFFHSLSVNIAKKHNIMHFILTICHSEASKITSSSKVLGKYQITHALKVTLNVMFIQSRRPEEPILDSFNKYELGLRSQYHTILYHTISYHTISYHTTPYHTIPHHTTPYHTISINFHTIPTRSTRINLVCLRSWYSRIA